LNHQKGKIIPHPEHPAQSLSPVPEHVDVLHALFEGIDVGIAPIVTNTNRIMGACKS
jgi:hypothetical protein